MSSEWRRDPYLGVVGVLFALALAGAVSSTGAGVWLANSVLLDVAVALLLASGVLGAVAFTRIARSWPQEAEPAPAPIVETPVVETPAAGEQEHAVGPDTAVGTDAGVAVDLKKKVHRLLWPRGWNFRDPVTLRRTIGGVGAFALLVLFFYTAPAVALTPLTAATAAGACAIGAGLAAAAVHYLRDIAVADLPEALWLSRGARVVAWMLVLAVISIGLEWLQQPAAIRVIHMTLFLVIAAMCGDLIDRPSVAERPPGTFPVELTILSALGSRTNVLASVLDMGERQLGIDLRSTWALTVIRRGVEPLLIGLAFVGWLSTSTSVVGTSELGLIERLGVTVGGDPLGPGLHVHLPWPIDRVIRIPVQRVQMITIGHEGEEQGGPEDVLWSREHAANEYTLLLGDGRDLVTVDAAVQFRIADPRAWRYRTQNPVDALRAIGYRAVMRNTVDRTLADALSENLVATTALMRKMVQQDADALGLGVEILGFTVGGMHPPVYVASAYQAVVSAQLGSVTAVVNAQAQRNQIVPYAQAAVLAAANTARADDANARARAAGESWSFLALQAQYRASPQEYLFRRRLETLENNLAQRRFTVVDSRFLRDGGELWVNP